ncbi:MAG: chemotaxis protein CheB [Deltaproteobacteria bacterium]|nr:chemotaxis protein CheB [Deltaproteobacteria bacterium]
MTEVKTDSPASDVVDDGVGFPIVGVGASAGGLAAFEAFFSAMPAGRETGMAFVLVQHLAPDHKSILSELIRRYTSMEVFEVEDGMKVRPDCAYIIPPNRDMAFLDGGLQLLEPAAPRGQRLPIDFFFRSLAHDQRERAIGVVLSGTGSDGTLGVRAIKGEGGMAMAQTPETTEYDGMPRNAIATGLVDFVLPPAEMPARLLSYADHAFKKKSRTASSSASSSPATPASEELLRQIFVLLRAQTEKDFSGYKKKTIIRRVERRMAVQQIDQLDEYVRYLQQAPAEVEALYHDLLIGVTSFFRDPEAFKVLTEQVIPRLLAAKPAGAAVRVWVPGCSTGEEAYSLAILLHERNVELKRGLKVQIFATDIDSRAIDAARRGVYPASIAADVSAERLTRFFTLDADGTSWRIHKTVRDMLVFSEHDLIRAPPFSKLDLISCRNLLIYLSAELQRRLVPLFHYALNPGGFLFLGTSETIGDFVELFSTVDRHAKVYERKADRDGPRGAAPRYLPRMTGPTATTATATATATAERKIKPREIAERALLQHTPVGALVDARGDILYLHGRSGRYLEPAPGEAALNILKMAREGLKPELGAALFKVSTTKQPARYPRLRVKTNGDYSTVHLSVHPIAGPTELFLVIIDERPADEQVERAALPVGVGVGVGVSATDPDATIAALTLELRAKEDYLQSANEELATSNEELKSSNEELQSTNEELQSTNEEMETSKEELQSVNEELATVNAEMQHKLHDLSRANNDMNNLLAGTGIGTLFVDHELRIQRFTPAVTAVFNLIATDLGRPIAHIGSNLVNYDRLVDDLRAVLDTLVPRELEVQIKAGSWYALAMRPYRTLDNVIEGAVVTFVDISEMKRGREAQRLAVVLRDARDAITVHDAHGQILAWNPGAERMYGWREAEALHMNVRELVPPPLRQEALERLEQLGRAQVLEPYRTQRLTRYGETLDVWLTATALIDRNGRTYAIATTERAIDVAQGAETTSEAKK